MMRSSFVRGVLWSCGLWCGHAGGGGETADVGSLHFVLGPRAQSTTFEYIVQYIIVQQTQLEDDGGGGLEDTEEDYDALNAETFGSAINGDWEFIHENLVRMDGGSNHRLSSAVGARAGVNVARDDNGESDLGECSATIYV